MTRTIDVLGKHCMKYEPTGEIRVDLDITVKGKLPQELQSGLSRATTPGMTEGGTGRQEKVGELVDEMIEEAGEVVPGEFMHAKVTQMLPQEEAEHTIRGTYRLNEEVNRGSEDTDTEPETGDCAHCGSLVVEEMPYIEGDGEVYCDINCYNEALST